MSSRHKEKNAGSERLDTSNSSASDKHVDPSPTAAATFDSSAPRTENTGVVVCQRDKRRREHNDLEKKRKEQIRACICRMGELLPPNYLTGERQSTLETVEKSLTYMRELKEAGSKFTAKEETLNREIEALKTERDKLMDIIKSAGLSTETIPTNGVSSTTDVKDDSPKPKSKSKKKAVVSSQVQNQGEKEKLSQQEMISSSVNMSDEAMNNMAANQMMAAGGMFMNGQNMMFNQMMMQNGNQLMMPGMVPPGNQLGPNMSGMGGANGNGGVPNATGNVLNGGVPNGVAQNDMTLNKSMEEADAGLLQLAMQDAGITPHSGVSQTSSSAMTPSTGDIGHDVAEPSPQSNPLQTLASVATSQGISADGSISDNQSVPNSVTGSVSLSVNNSSSVSTNSSNVALTTGMQAGFQQQQQNVVQGNNGALINMPMIGNQPVLPGQPPAPQTQQVMFINEQGIPMIANVPVGPDPNNQGVFANLQKQGLVPGLNQQTLLKDQQGNLDQSAMNNALALAQQQANMAALQSQLLGQGASGNLQNMGPFQQQNLLNGNIIQTQNGQFIQQITPQAQMQAQIQGQGQIVNMGGQGQGIVMGGQPGAMPVSQSGNYLTLNTMPSQPNQLPSALILPNGQIIPVVTNPSNVVSQGQGPTRMSAPQIQGQIATGLDGQPILGGTGSQGLLMTAVSGPPPVSTSAGASLSTSVVPTSAIQSVMTTQIQGSSVQTQKLAAAASASQPDVSNSTSQLKIIGMPTSGPASGPVVNSGGILQPGGKSAANPILISLPINGQPTTVLLDPVTMQVLGTVQSQQQQQQQQQPQAVSQVSTSATVAAVGNTSASHPAASQAQTSLATAGGGGKNKGNGNQRAICPKPSASGDGVKSQSAPAKKKRPSKSKSKQAVQPDSLTESLQIQIPESTTDPESASAVSTESTDILAKAAESIFSSPFGEMTNVGGFYNPANEDNPLHIDTSAAEADDENKSPVKNVGDVNRSDVVRSEGSTVPSVSVTSATLRNSVIGINSVADGSSKTVSMSVSSVVTSNSVVMTSTETPVSDSVTSLSATLEEITGIEFGDSQELPMEISQDKNDLIEMCMETKSSKKAKTSTNSKSNEAKKDIAGKPAGKQNVKSGGSVGGGSKGSAAKNKSADKFVDLYKSDNDSQMDIESTLINIPEVVTFSENDISDVLDQVEHMGNFPVDSPQKPQPSAGKKSKSKRSKAGDTDSEPSSKKRKVTKDAKELKGGVNTVAKESTLSMPATLSVYDFDDSDDIVPTILPLNAKDYTSMSTPQSMPTKAELGLSDVKTPKPVAQTKSKPPANQKSSKTVKNSGAKEADSGSEKNVNEQAPSATLFYFPESSEKKDDTKDKTESQKVSPAKSVESAPSMPEIDTTTSLFGFPVPKKLQRVDVSARQNAQVSPKINNNSQVSPKINTSVSSAAPKVSMVSPKEMLVSPKETITSPKQVKEPDNNLLSPKLSIVSPGQNLLSDSSDNMTASPKSYAEMTPVKKRSQPDRGLSDDICMTSFSALNTVTPAPTPSISESCALVSSSTSQPVSGSSIQSQTGSVITSAKQTVSPVKSDLSSSNLSKSKDSGKVHTENTYKMGSSENIPGMFQSSKQSSVMPGSKSQTNTNTSRTFPNTSMESTFNMPNMSSTNYNKSTSMNSQHRLPSSMNPPHSNTKLPTNQQFSHDMPFSSMPNMNSKGMSKDGGMGPSSMPSMNNFSGPYSSDSVYSHQDKVIKSPPNVNISTNPSILNQQKEDNSNMNKARSNAYSVDSFVQSSRDGTMRLRNDALTAQSDLMSGPDLTSASSDFSRLQSESSPDGFNFANIGLNLPPITSSTASSSYMDLNLPNSSAVISSNSSTSSSFSFSLSSTSSTATTSSGGLGQHHFPFYPVLSTSASVASSDSVMQTPSMSTMGMFGPSSSNVIQRNNTVMHPSGSNPSMPRGDNSHISRVDSSISRVDNPHSMPRGDTSQQIRSDDVNRDQSNANKPSCSKQSKMSKGPNPGSAPPPQPPFNYPTSSSAHDQFFHDTQMKSNVGKSPTEQMRKPQDTMPGAQSRMSTQNTHQDKRSSNVDRSPQMMNNAQPYFSPNYASAKSLNTPPLHHQSMMMPEDRSRSMTNRSPYDTPYPAPPSSQGFNSMPPHNYPGNRLESGNTNYNRDSSGTQPLSHTPINSSGRKSANPQASVVKPPQKPAAPPLVPMAPQQQPQTSNQPPRPTPPQQQSTHRSTTPLSNPAPAPTPTQVNQSRQSKQTSRSKQQKKTSKPLPFVEVDSNLSNSIFETNRSMTPFFPVQNLSPQSRSMQHEGSPFLPGNFFPPGPRFPNSNTPMPKNSDITAPFNPLFPPRGAQNGLGLNFQPGFGMNMNHLHGNHGNGPQITPHTAPHMANFNLNNIFSDVNSASQNESLNISPIKFPHTNFQHQGMDPNAMQHHHQYNRGHHSVMSINSILGPNHHGFDGRMNTSMAGPFHTHGPSFIPPLNFSMHDH